MPRRDHPGQRQWIAYGERATGGSSEEAQLHHPNIVGTHGMGRFPYGSYFIVMDFVDGTDLRAKLKSGPLVLAEALRIIMQVADAMEYAHTNGIVHCDLKPANIVISKRNVA